MACSGDAITMYTHTGAHIDTLNHFGYENEIFNGFTSKDILAAGHGMSAAQKTFRQSSRAAFWLMLRRYTALIRWRQVIRLAKTILKAL